MYVFGIVVVDVLGISVVVPEGHVNTSGLAVVVLLAFFGNFGLSEGKFVYVSGLSVVVDIIPKVGLTWKKSLLLKDGGLNFCPKPNS